MKAPLPMALPKPTVIHFTRSLALNVPGIIAH